MKIGYLNHAFNESHALTVTGATVEAGSLANLRVPQLDQRVRLAGDPVPSPIQIVINDTPAESAGRTVQVVALLDIEVESTGLDEVIFYITATGSAGSVVASPVNVPIPPDGFPRHLIAILDEPVTDCDEVEIIIDGMPTAPGLGPRSMTITASALWVGPLQVITTEQGGALEESSAYGIEDGGEVQRTKGGQVYAETAGAIRTHTGSTVFITRAEAFGDGSGGMDVQQLMASARTTRQILWIPDDSTQHLLHRLTIYGHMTQVGRLVPRGPFVRWEGWQVRESR